MFGGYVPPPRSTLPKRERWRKVRLLRESLPRCATVPTARLVHVVPSSGYKALRTPHDVGSLRFQEGPSSALRQGNVTATRRGTALERQTGRAFPRRPARTLRGALCTQIHHGDSAPRTRCDAFWPAPSARARRRVVTSCPRASTSLRRRGWPPDPAQSLSCPRYEVLSSWDLAVSRIRPWLAELS